MRALLLLVFCIVGITGIALATPWLMRGGAVRERRGLTTPWLMRGNTIREYRGVPFDLHAHGLTSTALEESNMQQLKEMTHAKIICCSKKSKALLQEVKDEEEMTQNVLSQLLHKLLEELRKRQAHLCVSPVNTVQFNQL